MIYANSLDRELLDTRTSGKGGRKRVDAYFVLFDCPADDINPGGPHQWACRFEVPRGTPFKMPVRFANKDAARAARGFTP